MTAGGGGAGQGGWVFSRDKTLVGYPIPQSQMVKLKCIYIGITLNGLTHMYVIITKDTINVKGNKEHGRSWRSMGCKYLCMKLSKN